MQKYSPEQSNAVFQALQEASKQDPALHALRGKVDKIASDLADADLFAMVDGHWVLPDRVFYEWLVLRSASYLP